MAKVYGKAAGNIIERIAARCMRAADQMAARGAKDASKSATKRATLPKQSKPRHHMGMMIVRDGKPTTSKVREFISGGMTDAQKKAGWPGQTASHTEQKAVKELLDSGELRPGDVLVLGGQKPPCPPCKGKLNDLFRALNGEVAIRYDYPGGEAWLADGGRKWKGK